MSRRVEYFLIVACIVGSVAIVSATARFDLLVFVLLSTYLVVSLALPRVPRHRAAAYRAAQSVGAGVLRGAPAPTPDSPSSRLRQNAATVG